MKVPVILMISFILQVSGIVRGQQITFKVYSLDDALVQSFNNHPVPFSYGGKKRLGSDVKSAWYLWIYSIQKLNVLGEYHDALGDLNRIVNLHYQTGDIDAFENAALLGKIADIQTSLALMANNVEIVHYKLQNLLYLKGRIVPSDSILSLYKIDKEYTERWGFANIIDSQSSDTANIAYSTFVRLNQIEIKQLELDNIFIKLQFYLSYGLDFSNTIIQTSTAKYKAEEIDYIKFVEYLAEAYKIQLDYLDVLNSYNQNAIELEYYVY